MPNSEAKIMGNKKYRHTTKKINKIRIEITRELHAKLKAVAKEKNTTMVKIIEELVKIAKCKS